MLFTTRTAPAHEGGFIPVTPRANFRIFSASYRFVILLDMSCHAAAVVWMILMMLMIMMIMMMIMMMMIDDGTMLTSHQ